MRGKTNDEFGGRAKPAQPARGGRTSPDMDANGSQACAVDDVPGTQRAGFDLYSDARSRWRGSH